MDYQGWIGKKVFIKYNRDNCLVKDSCNRNCYGHLSVGVTGTVVAFDGEFFELEDGTNRWPCRCVLVEEEKIITISSCPRCSGELIKKEAEEPFTGKKYMIDKCQDCGWC